jgi:F-type H+-transporting ATPase subunit delta
MSAPRVASRYAKSLLSLAEEKQQLDAVEKDIELVLNTVAASDELQLVLASPVLNADQKQRVLDAVFKEHLSPLMMEFITILVRKGRVSILAPIAEACTKMLRTMKGIQSAEVITAVSLEGAAKDRLMAELKRLHDGEVELKETVNPDIIGGFVLRVEDRMLDASVRRSLQRLRRELTEHDYDPEF